MCLTVCYKHLKSEQLNVTVNIINNFQQAIMHCFSQSVVLFVLGINLMFYTSDLFLSLL